MKNTGVGSHKGKGTPATKSGVSHKGQGKPASQSAKGMKGGKSGATKE